MIYYERGIDEVTKRAVVATGAALLCTGNACNAMSAGLYTEKTRTVPTKPISRRSPSITAEMTGGGIDAGNWSCWVFDNAVLADLVRRDDLLNSSFLLGGEDEVSYLAPFEVTDAAWDDMIADWDAPALSLSTADSDKVEATIVDGGWLVPAPYHGWDSELE